MVKFSDIMLDSKIYLYAGAMPMNRRKTIPFIGVSDQIENETCVDHRVFTLFVSRI